MGRKAWFFGLVVGVVLLQTTGCSKVRQWLGGAERTDAHGESKGKRPKRLDTLAGDFRSRCKACNIKNHRLTCVCDGLQSSLDLPCGFVSVLDRALACTALPKGSYANSCRNCVMHRDNSQVTVECDCAAPDGEWKRQPQPVRLNPVSCVQLTNESGVLTCSKSPVDAGLCQFPNGSYAMSCGQCAMTCDPQTTLTCTCAPNTAPSSIVLQTCPSGSISNADGALKCDPLTAERAQ
jgi:hypothetical protein